VQGNPVVHATRPNYNEECYERWCPRKVQSGRVSLFSKLLQGGVDRKLTLNKKECSVSVCLSVNICVAYTNILISGIRMVEIRVLLWNKCGSVSCGERWYKNSNSSGQVLQSKSFRLAGKKPS
jgi:hypothetical protein